jgi:uncharacterized protein YjbI with pentapeptide repeats
MRIRTITILVLLAVAGSVFGFAVYAQTSSNRDKLINDRSCAPCDLSGVDLSGEDLRNVNLYKSNLRGANLSNANLGGANLFGARLEDANLDNANLTLANLKDAVIFPLALKSAVTSSSTTCPNGQAGPCE